MIPTTPGYYWRLGPNHDNEYCEQVVLVDQLVTTDPTLFYWEAGNMGAIAILNMPGVNWYGPIDKADYVPE